MSVWRYDRAFEEFGAYVFTSINIWRERCCDITRPHSTSIQHRKEQADFYYVQRCMICERAKIEGDLSNFSHTYTQEIISVVVKTLTCFGNGVGYGACFPTRMLVVGPRLTHMSVKQKSVEVPRLKQCQSM